MTEIQELPDAAVCPSKQEARNRPGEETFKFSRDSFASPPPKGTEQTCGSDSKADSKVSAEINLIPQKFVTGKWTDEEHARFLEALRIFGKNWRKVEEHIGTRSAIQARTHAQKFFGKAFDKMASPFGTTKFEVAKEEPKVEAITSNQLPTAVEASMTEREKEYFQTFVAATPSTSACSTAFSSPTEPKDQKVMVNQLLSAFGTYGQNTRKSPFQVQRVIDGKEVVDITKLKRGRKAGSKKRAYTRKERSEKPTSEEADEEVMPPAPKRQRTSEPEDGFCGFSASSSLTQVFGLSKRNTGALCAAP